MEKWVPNPEPPQRKTSSVEQPPWARVCPRARKHLAFYRPLRYKRLPEDCIRLLDLREAQMTGDVLVGCRLVTVSFSTAPAYEAISYCWGSTDLCTGIFVSTSDRGEHVCRVTENLATCLHSLLTATRAGGDRPGYIWVDQLCINQEDTGERSAQVRRIAEIYRSAVRVIIWLGQEADFNLKDHELDMRSPPIIQWCDKDMISSSRVLKMVTRPWFTRLWVFQEAVFARQILVLMGTKYLPWESLFDMTKDFKGIIVELLRDLDRELKPNVWYSLGLTGHYVVTKIETTRKAMQEQKQVDLENLLYFLIYHHCQDAKDKIFGIAGFAGDTLPADLVNYRKSITYVNQSFTRHYIEQTGDLRAITYLNRGFLDRRPSWVPLWHEELVGSIEYCLQAPSSSRHRSWKSPAGVVEDQLDVSGKLFDVVAVELHSFQRSMSTFFIKRELGTTLQDSFQEARCHINASRGSASESKASCDTETESENNAKAPPDNREPSAWHDFIKDFLCVVFCDDRLVSALVREDLYQAYSEDLRSSGHAGDVMFAELLSLGPKSPRPAVTA